MRHKMLIAVLFALLPVYEALGYDAIAPGVLVQAMKDYRQQVGGFEAVTTVTRESFVESTKRGGTVSFSPPRRVSATFFWRENTQGDMYAYRVLDHDETTIQYNADWIVCDGASLAMNTRSPRSGDFHGEVYNSSNAEAVAYRSQVGDVRRLLYISGASSLGLVFPDQGRPLCVPVADDPAADDATAYCPLRHEGGSEFETIDGNLTVKVTTWMEHGPPRGFEYADPSRKSKPDDVYAITWLDINKGYIPCRTEKPISRGPVLVNVRYEVKKFHEVKPGLWFPVRGTKTALRRADEKSDWTTLSTSTYEVGVSSLKVAQTFTASDFKPEWEPGQFIRYKYEQRNLVYLGRDENGEDIITSLGRGAQATQPTP